MQGCFITEWLHPASPRPCDAHAAALKHIQLTLPRQARLGLLGTRVLVPMGHTRVGTWTCVFSSAVTWSWDVFQGGLGTTGSPAASMAVGGSRSRVEGRKACCGPLGAQFSVPPSPAGSAEVQNPEGLPHRGGSLSPCPECRRAPRAVVGIAHGQGLPQLVLPRGFGAAGRGG